jgi:hypothetical protein
MMISKLKILGAAMLACVLTLLPGSTGAAQGGKARTGPSGDIESEPPRAWFILSQDDTNGLLHGLPQRLGKAILPSRHHSPMWEGVEGGGRLELDVQVQGEAPGEVFVGFFADPRWWAAEPVQARSFPPVTPKTLTP